MAQRRRPRSVPARARGGRELRPTARPGGRFSAGELLQRAGEFTRLMAAGGRHPDLSLEQRRRLTRFTTPVEYVAWVPMYPFLRSLEQKGFDPLTARGVYEQYLRQYRAQQQRRTRRPGGV